MGAYRNERATCLQTDKLETRINARAWQELFRRFRKRKPRPGPGSDATCETQWDYLLPGGGLRLANRRIWVLPSGAFTNTGCEVVT